MALTKVDISLMDNTGTTANKLLAYDGSGNLPAVDGSQLTNVATGITESSSDPTISTNPSGGVGTQWNNTTSGEVYICTDATAGENVWTNVGAGTGDVQPWYFGGVNEGWTHCGGPSTYYNNVDAFSFTSDGNATDVGDNTDPRAYLAGNKSSTHGYVSGGDSGGRTNIIDKHSYSAGGNATDVGDLFATEAWCRGVSSATTGWISGFEGQTTFNTTVIQKISFSSDGNAVSSAAVLTVQCAGHANATSADYGYAAGGYNQNAIQKFSLSAENDATDVGDLSGNTWETCGQSSETHGYQSGHNNISPSSNAIEKWSFATDGNSVDVGDITVARGHTAGTSSRTYGYVSGGNYPTATNIIEKHAFANSNNATDIGDLSQARFSAAGTEH